MSALAQVFIAAAVLVHVLAFVFEVLLFERPPIHRDLFTIPSEDLQRPGCGHSTSGSTTCSWPLARRSA
jgi:hypothetical protein